MPAIHPRHESVLALLQEALPGESAESIITRKARDVISKHRQLWLGPPYCPVALADLEGIIVEEAPCDIPGDGRIFPVGKQVYIQYAQGQCEERRRFTICHELAHTLFPDCYRRVRRRSRISPAEREFENLCHAGAAEFLFPIESILADLNEGNPDAATIVSLAKRYRASVDATARRIVGVLGSSACAVFARYRLPRGKSVTSLSVQYAVPNRSFPYKVLPGLKINSKSVANEAYATGVPRSSNAENWNIAGRWARMEVHAVPLPKFFVRDAADMMIMLYT